MKQEVAEIPALRPLDEHNRLLQERVHPPGWTNPVPSGRYNAVVIGAGPAGLVTAAAAAGLGGKVALIERGLLGGDCLNVGCVPSKALIRCARAAAEVRDAAQFGVIIDGGVRVDFGKVMERMREIRARMSVHDSVQRFTDMGIDVFLGHACFEGPDTIAVGGQTLRFARAIIATGARAAELPIPGLNETGYLTNETVFSLTELPPRLAVIGAGPVGCELAQSFARLGAEVTLIEMDERILPREHASAAQCVHTTMERDGVRILCGATVTSAAQESGGKALEVALAGGSETVRADEILLAAGRTPNVDGLGLEAAGIQYDPRKGIQTDDYLRTTNPRVYAAGDVASAHAFTHAADAMARIAVQNALFFGRAKVSALTIPRCTYTDPEVAHTGLSADEAAQRGYTVDTITIPMNTVDRAILDGDEDGFLQVHLKRGAGTILGAAMVSRHAGESISELTAIMTSGKKISALAKTIHPYPTQAEAIKKAADTYNRQRLTPAVHTLFKTILALRR